MKQAQISPEIYELVKVQVLAEMKATNKARADERKRERDEERESVRKMFEPVRHKYTPLLAQQYRSTFASGRTLYDVIESRINEAIRIAIRTVGFFNEFDVYRNGKTDEVTQMASEILDAILKK